MLAWNRRPGLLAATAPSITTRPTSKHVVAVERPHMMRYRIHSAVAARLIVATDRASASDASTNGERASQYVASTIADARIPAG